MKKLSPLHIAMVLLTLSSLLHVSSTEAGHGLRMLQGMKATSTSYATTQAIHVDEAEFMHDGSMGFVLNDYPASGANNRHSSCPGGAR